MNRISADMFPMMVSPQDFKINDVVKKIYMDNIQTPYVGIVTSVIPSTNKVEVQWPHSTGLEDPWDLTKVNPILHPPVVKKDKAYDTYQKRKNNEKYMKDLQHYSILDEYLKEHLKPILLHASDMYNDGYSKAKTYKCLTANFDNKDIIKNALDSLYNDDINITKATKLVIDGKETYSELIFKGNSNQGFKLAYILGNKEEKYSYDSYITAVENYNRLKGIFKSLTSENNLSLVVSKVIKNYTKLQKNGV